MSRRSRSVPRRRPLGRILSGRGNVRCRSHFLLALVATSRSSTAWASLGRSRISTAIPLLVGRSIVIRGEDPDVCELAAHVGLQIGSHLFEGVLREDVDHAHLAGRLRGNAGDFYVATFVSYYFSFCGIGWCWNPLSSREDKLRSKPPVCVAVGGTTSRTPFRRARFSRASSSSTSSPHSTACCPRRRRARKRGRGRVFLSETLRDEPNDAPEANAARLSI
jgi:hypothetical protein